MNQKPKKKHSVVRRLQFWGVVLLILTIAGTAWSGWWALLGWLVPSWGGWWHGLVSVWLGFLVMMFGAIFWGRLVGDRRNDFFKPFNEAFSRIAAGDYTAQVPIDPKHREEHTPFVDLAENLNAMTSSLAKMEELRRQFVADVSHEFQSPLTSILGFALALRSDLKDEVRQRYLGIIETEARRLSRLSDTLLKLNALEDRVEVPDPAPFRLDVQLRHVIVALEPQWTAKGLEVEADLNEAEIEGNEELWTQVWTNLLHNAVKFTPKGGRITVRMAEPFAVEIEDDGIGLTEDEAERVFERFYKAESARSHTEGSGSGLGLALVHRIVTLHGASVAVVSRGPGHGALFRVSWPTP